MYNSKALIEVLSRGDAEALKQTVTAALEEGVSADTILQEGLMAGMDIVGEKMENEDLFIPEVLMAAKAMGAALEILKPHLTEEALNAQGVVVIGTVKGDLHDIGKNLVAMMLESAGLVVHNIGVDIPPATFVQQVKDYKASVLCLSALLTTTMPMMKETVGAFVEAGLKQDVKIVVGGAPVTESFATEIGADGYASDAGGAVRLVKGLLN